LRPPWQYVSPDTPSRHNQPVLPLLSAHGLSQSFGPDDVFSGVSLSIPEGGKIGLVGPNGIGKTTLAPEVEIVYTPLALFAAALARYKKYTDKEWGLGLTASPSRSWKRVAFNRL
jgi:ABC-type phosphonate transport system ATPase subunit